RGYGKRTALRDYPTKNRGGKGVITIKVSERNGPVAAIRIVTAEDHLILISDRGKLIRIRATDVSVMGRSAQGVRMMRLDDGESVAAVERLANPDDATDIATEEVEAPTAEDTAEEAVDETDDTDGDEADESDETE